MMLYLRVILGDSKSPINRLSVRVTIMREVVSALPSTLGCRTWGSIP